MKVSFEGIGEEVITFEAQAGVEAGKTVELSANGTVAPCTDGSVPCGVAVSVRDGAAAVAVAGYCRVKYSGAVPNVGYTLLAADASGGVKAMASGGRQLLVTDVDKQTGTIGIIL